MRERGKCRPLSLPDYSSGLRRGAHLHQRRQPQHGLSCKSSKDASAIDAVADTPENVFHFFNAQVGIELIDRNLACERAVGGAEPLSSLVGIADHLNRRGVDSR